MKKKRMNKLIWIVVAVILLFLWNTDKKTAGGLTYYVDQKNPSCSDSYTKEQAVNIDTPFCTANKGITSLQSGDTLKICSGEYARPSQITLQNLVLAEKTIITSCDGNHPVLKGYAKVSSWVDQSTSSYKLYKGVYNSSAGVVIVYNNATKEIYFAHSSYANMMNSTKPEGSYWNNAIDAIYLRFKTTTNVDLNNIVVASDYVLYLSGISGNELEISNIDINMGTTGIYLSNVGNLVMDNLDIYSSKKGVHLYQSHDITLRNSDISSYHGNWARDDWYGSIGESSGVFTTQSGTNINIYNNIFHTLANGVFTDATGMNYNQNIKVYGNTIYDIWDDAIEIEEYCYNGEYYDNTIYDAFVGFSIIPITSSTAERKCLIHHNKITADKSELFKGSTYYPGECFKTTGDGPAAYFDIHHNTCTGVTGIYAGSTNMHTQNNMNWKDNIFYTSGTAVYKSGLASDKVFYDYNLYYKTTGSSLLAYWNSDDSSTMYSLAGAKASAQWDGKWDVHSVQADPQFVQGTLQPQAGSPACAMSSTGSFVGAVPCVGQTYYCGNPSCRVGEICSGCDGCVSDIDYPSASAAWKQQTGLITDAQMPLAVYNWKSMEGCI